MLKIFKAFKEEIEKGGEREREREREKDLQCLEGLVHP